MLNTFPIFAKELYEMAGRKSTYLLRVIYAVAIMACFHFLAQRLAASDPSNMPRMGIGGALHQQLVTAQFFLILLIVPPMVANAITHEKENHTLTDLLTLPLSTANILFQKFAGRLLPIVSLLLVSLPLFALTFTLGGVNRTMVFAATLNCIMCALAVGALALAVSCSRDTSLRATIETYGWLLLLAPPCLGPIPITSLSSEPGPILFSTFIALVFITTCFVHASRNFRKKADDHPIDTEPASDNTAKHKAELARKSIAGKRIQHGDPDKRPLAWLETSRSSFNQTEYYVLLLVGMTILLLTNLFASISLYVPFSALPFLLFLACLFRILNSQAMITRLKRSDRLLTLLALPMAPKDFLRDLHHAHMVGTWRLLAFIACALIPGCFRLWAEIAATSKFYAVLYPLTQYACLLIAFYLTFTTFQWAGMLFALRSRKAGHSLAASLATVALLAGATHMLFPAVLTDMRNVIELPMYLMPSYYFSTQDTDLYLWRTPIECAIWFGHLLVSSSIYCVGWMLLLLSLRHYTLSRATKLLHRAAQPR